MTELLNVSCKQNRGRGGLNLRLAEFKAHMRKHALAWEIGLILALKLVVIIAIKDSYFSEPLPRDQVQQAMQQLWQADQAHDLVPSSSQSASSQRVQQ